MDLVSQETGIEEEDEVFSQADLQSIIQGQAKKLAEQEELIRQLTARLDNVSSLSQGVSVSAGVGTLGTQSVVTTTWSFPTSSDTHVTYTTGGLGRGPLISCPVTGFGNTFMGGATATNADDVKTSFTSGRLPFVSSAGIPLSVGGTGQSNANQSGKGGRKHSKNKKKFDTSVITIDDSSSDSCAGYVSSDSSSTEGKTKQPKKRIDPELELLVNAINQKESPKPEPYSLVSGRSFRKFLDNFEAYCSSRFSAINKDLWTSELGRFLEGEIKEVYEVLQGAEQGYRTMKKQLQAWHLDAKTRIQSSRRVQFQNARYKPGEGYKLFATRLEYLYRAAYPHQEVLNGKDLRRQLFKTLPTDVSEILERDLAVMKTTTARKATWKDILSLLEIQDNSRRRKERESSLAPQGSLPQNSVLRPEVSPWKGTNNIHMMEVTVPTHQPVQRSRMPTYQPFQRSGVPTYQPVQRLRMPRPGEYVNSSQDNYVPYCKWCRKRYHTYENCRRRLNLCLRCGAPDHHIANCILEPPQHVERDLRYTGAIPRNPVMQNRYDHPKDGFDGVEYRRSRSANRRSFSASRPQDPHKSRSQPPATAPVYCEDVTPANPHEQALNK